MARIGRKEGVARELAVATMAASFLLAACGTRARLPETSPAPSARPVSEPKPETSIAPAVQDAGTATASLPRGVSLDAFGEGDRIADLAGLAVGDRVLLAWVTYFDDAAASLRTKRAGRTASRAVASSVPTKQGASVFVRPLDGRADVLGPPKVISVKAVSAGGVALARGLGSRSEVGLGWVGMDGGVGQVFATKLSEMGDREAQHMITHSKSGCSDVAIAAVSDGFVVAWIEATQPKTQVVAAKLGKDLAPMGAERRIAENKGEASDVRLIRRGDDVLVAWNDAGVDGDGGVAAARLLASDLTVRADPAVVLAAPRHPRGLEVASLGEGVEVAWVEDAAASAGEGGNPVRALRLARLDPSTRSSSERTTVPAVLDSTSVALDCDRICRVVVPVADRGELALYGFWYDGSVGPGTPQHLFSFSGVSTEDTSPVLVGDWLFFAEDNLHGGGRIRKAKLAWR